MAVALAKPNSNHLHLTPDKQPCQHLITRLFLQARCSSWCQTNSAAKALKASLNETLMTKMVPHISYTKL